MNQPMKDRSGRRRFLHQSACGAVTILAATRAIQAEPLTRTVSELREVNRIALTSSSARRIAAASDGSLWLATGKTIQRLAANGETLSQIDLARPARCLAVSPEGIFVGIRDGVSQFNALGQCIWTSSSIGDGHLVGDVHVEDTTLTVTDVTSGERLVTQINEPQSSWSSIRFSQAARVSASNRVVRHGSEQWAITDPGRHRVVVVDNAGRTVSTWGRRSRDIDGFQGCCNPMAMVELADGSWVTAEAGQVRIKRFDANGQFMHLIAGPESIATLATSDEDDPQLRCRIGGIDLATNSNGDLWLLHAAAAQLIHYRYQA